MIAHAEEVGDVGQETHGPDEEEVEGHGPPGVDAPVEVSVADGDVPVDGDAG